MTEDEFIRYALGRSPTAEELARLQVIKSAARSSGIDPAIFPVLFGMRERADYSDLPSKIRDAGADAAQLIDCAINRGPTENDRIQLARFRAHIHEVVEARKFDRHHMRTQIALSSMIVAAMFTFGMVCGTQIAVARGIVSDEIYRLERLGAGWELYRSQLRPEDADRADRFIGHHMVYLPNPR